MIDQQTLHPRAADLLAYADGRLNGEAKNELETLLEKDGSARAFLLQIKASELPYSNAFEPLLNVLNTDDLIAPLNSPPIQTSRSIWRRWQPGRTFQIAAGLLLGVGLAFTYQHFSTVDRSNWMVQVAEYQQLYVRETVINKAITPSQFERLQLRLGGALGTPFTIPDLSGYQLTFMRGQVLQVNNQPLIQLVYLPQHGKPIALCITPRQFANTELTIDSARGLAMVHWNDKANSFVLMGEHSTELLINSAREAKKQIESAHNYAESIQSI